MPGYRWSFRKLPLAGFASILLACILLLPAAAFASSVPDHVTLTWTMDPRTTQTITWRTDVSVTTGQVHFFEVGEGQTVPPNIRSAMAETNLLSTNIKDVNIHTVNLTGLIPGKRYGYEVGYGSEWSESRSFVTAPVTARNFNFLIFGDSQSNDYEIWRDTVQQAYRANPSAAFFVNTGDLVDIGQDYAEWEKWFAAVSGVVDRISAMPLAGNHETYSPERRFSMPVYFTAQFKLPANGPEELKGQVYSFDYGDAHFVMLDTQEGEERRFVPDMLKKQQSWLAADLAASDRKWNIAFIHRPIYGNKTNGVNENIRQAFESIFEQYQVDLVFTAHDHVLARTVPLAGGEAVKAPLRGTVYMAAGRSGTKTYSDVSANDWNVFFRNPIGEPNYLTVTVDEEALTVKSFTQSGSLIDGWSLTK